MRAARASRIGAKVHGPDQPREPPETILDAFGAFCRGLYLPAAVDDSSGSGCDLRWNGPWITWAIRAIVKAVRTSTSRARTSQQFSGKRAYRTPRIECPLLTLPRYFPGTETRTKPAPTQIGDHDIPRYRCLVAKKWRGQGIGTARCPLAKRQVRHHIPVGGKACVLTALDADNNRGNRDVNTGRIIRKHATLKHNFSRHHNKFDFDQLEIAKIVGAMVGTSGRSTATCCEAPGYTSRCFSDDYPYTFNLNHIDSDSAPLDNIPTALS
jgi:hypothetical protein